MRRRPHAGPGPAVVAVDGPSGAGKTDFATALAHALDGAPVVAMDDLYPGWDGLEAAVPLLTAEVLAPLGAGRPARFRRYDWAAGRRGELVVVPAAPVVVVEGVGCGAREPAAHVDLLVWLDAAPAVRFARGMARDGETYRPHWRRWAAQEEVLFAREETRARADVRFRSDPPGPGGGLVREPADA
ncbi:hypothetical protein GTR02_05555 [Kineococcus sp. R8]|nr:hypothetical protein [Kineococcus siccus]